MNLHTDLVREQACSEDLIKEIRMHIQECRFDLAERRTADLMKSINHMKYLQRRLDERKRLLKISSELAKRGLTGKVVSLYEETAR